MAIAGWSGGAPWSLARGQFWRATGGLRQLRNDVTGASPFAPGVHTLFDTDPAAAYDSLSPVWTELQGSGGPAHTLLDSLQYDGWERVTQARYLRDGSGSRAEAFRFDPAGNATIDSVAGTAESWTFASPGQPLLSARGCTFTYDAAGGARLRKRGRSLPASVPALDSHPWRARNATVGATSPSAW